MVQNFSHLCGLGSFLFTDLSLKHLLQLCWKSSWSGFGAGPDQVRAGRVPKAAMVGSIALDEGKMRKKPWDGSRDSQMTHENMRHLERFLWWDTRKVPMVGHNATRRMNEILTVAFSGLSVQFRHSHHMFFQCRSQFVKKKGFASSDLLSEICLSLVYCSQILSQIKSRLPIYSKKDDFSLNWTISEIVQMNQSVLSSLSLWSSFYAYAEILFSLSLLIS